MTKKRILLLDPPSKSPVLRDYYCSSIPKAYYRWHPIDLLVMAALLKDKAEIKVLDAQSEGINEKEALQIIRDFAPHTVFALVSRLKAEEDLRFLSLLAEFGARIVISGEKALDPDFNFSKYSFVDGIILDFSAESSARFLLGEAPHGRIRTRDFVPSEPPRNEQFALGIPPHDLFYGKYRLPLERGKFYSLLTDFGCPFSCAFCNSGVNSIGYKERAIEDIEEECKELKKLKAKKIYLRDMTFVPRKERALKLLGSLSKYNFSLRGYLRPDVLDEELVEALARAGFKLAQLGVEAPRGSSRRRLGKAMEDEKIVHALTLLRKAGIGYGFHFLLDASSDRLDGAFQCAEFARKKKALYCSINVYEPRFGADPMVMPEVRKLLRHKVVSKLAMALFHISPYQLIFCEMFSKEYNKTAK